MLSILSEEIEEGFKVIRYTKDGETVTHTVKTPIQTESSELIEPQPTIEEQIYAENLYQTALLEIQMLGGVQNDTVSNLGKND